MNNLQEATERICELKGSIVALDTLLSAMLAELPAHRRDSLAATFNAHAEVARTVLLHASISELTIARFEHDIQRIASLVGGKLPGSSG